MSPTPRTDATHLERSDRPAVGLALWCVRSTGSSRSAGEPPIGRLDSEDWADFLRICLAHAVAPIAWRTLRPHAAGLPELVAQDLRNAFEANTRRNLWLGGQLVDMLRLLESAGVAAVPWKGPVLAQRAYGDLRLRQFYDLDILVRRHQLDAARDLLMARGFRTEKRMTHAQQEAYIEHQGELELVRDADGIWLELHTAIVATYYAGAQRSEHLWQRIVRTPLLRTSVWALSPIDELEALAVHGSKHRWERLAWILDVALVANSLDAHDWLAVLEGARSRGTLRMVLLGLWLAATECGAQLPDVVVAAAHADPAARRLASDVRRALFDPQSNRFDSLVFHARMRERPVDRARYLFNVAYRPSGADWESLRLPRGLFPLYALTRPGRLALKYGARLVAWPRSPR